MRLFVESIGSSPQGDIEPGDQHVIEVFSVERVQDGFFQLLRRFFNVDWLRDVDIGGGAEVTHLGRVDHGTPLHVGLQGIIVAGDHQLLGLDNGELKKKHDYSYI